MKILDYALALDGGTRVITLDTGDGRQACIGLDGRMDAPPGGRILLDCMGMLFLREIEQRDLD